MTPRLRLPRLALAALLLLALPAAAAPTPDDADGPLAWLTDAWTAAVHWIQAAAGMPGDAEGGNSAAAEAPQESGAGGDAGAEMDPDD